MAYLSRHAAKVAKCEEQIGYTFKDRKLCAEALNLAGDAMAVYADNGLMSRLAKNDRLAVYGDVVMAQQLCILWYHGKLPKGDWDRIRQGVLRNDNLAQVGFDHDLRDCVTTNQGTHLISSKMMATTVEAVLGAVHIDGGNDAMVETMNRLGLTHPILQTILTFMNALKFPIVDAPTTPQVFWSHNPDVFFLQGEDVLLCQNWHWPHVPIFLAEATRVVAL